MIRCKATDKQLTDLGFIDRPFAHVHYYNGGQCIVTINKHDYRITTSWLEYSYAGSQVPVPNIFMELLKKDYVMKVVE